MIFDNSNPPYSDFSHIIPTYICMDMITDDVTYRSDMTLAEKTKSGAIHDGQADRWMAGDEM